MTLFAFMSPRRKEQIRKSLGGPSVQDADVQSVEPVPGEPSDG